jgi:ferredoxin
MKSRYSFKDYDNKAFYNSKAWQKVSAAYMASQAYICERCGKPASICHHKKWLNGSNVNDPNIALSFDNLEALCIECHNAEHGLQHSITLFNEDGSIARVKESQGAKDFKRQAEKIDDLLARLQKNDPPESP